MLPLSLSAEQFDGIEIAGNDVFRNEVRNALTLLKERAPTYFAQVKSYIGRIEDGKHSAMWAYRNPPTFELNLEKTCSTTTWCAGSIAHESCHSKLYHDYTKQNPGIVPDSIWTGQAIEKKCIQYQILAMKQMAAPFLEIKSLESRDGSHADVNKDGKLDWNDYYERTW